ncbi:uncharacterized protein LOC143521582 isoform X2 [Brachyhypopomus gauderio]|uniref:uncharacterized protein LOC143521582 isoform X2 n=1 Tax=Brachyhypopomus gauderio TaxID=698409 RepID=UPI0040437A72
MIKKRDLLQTHLFKITCRVLFGPPKSRDRIIVAPPMSRFLVMTCGRTKLPDLTITTGLGNESAAAQRFRSYPGMEHVELADWIRERRAFREGLDGLGDLDKWFYSKPDLTEMEILVMDRGKQTQKMLPGALPDTTKVARPMNRETSSQMQAGCEFQLEDAEDDIHRGEILPNPVQMGSTTQEAHSYPSSLGGPTGDIVDGFRGQSLEEYLNCVEQSKRQGLFISQTTLKRALLYPGDVSVCKELALRQAGSSALPGPQNRGRGRESYASPPRYGTEEENIDKRKGHKDRCRSFTSSSENVKYTECSLLADARKMSRVLSSLLTTRENGLLFNLVGQDCSVSACAVVQLYLATSPREGQKSQWEIYSCGVLCLVRDRKLNSTFMRLFSVKRAKLLWEQELYTPFEYSTPCHYFHTFPSDDCRAGLNFANEEEACRFCSAVQKCISSTKVPCTLVRSHSLDSTSPWLLRDKLNACLTASLTGRRPGTNEVMSSPMDQPGASPRTLSNSTAGSVSLAERKGPLPPIPSHASTASPAPVHAEVQNLTAGFSVPLPPPYPAPRLIGNLAGVKKSASFSPGENYSYAAMKTQRSLHSTANKGTKS